MQLQSCHARHVANAAEVRANFLESRARLLAAKPRNPVVPVPAPEIITPVKVDGWALVPVAELAQVIIHPPVPVRLNGRQFRSSLTTNRIAEIVRATAAAIGITPDTLMSGVDSNSREGRRVAAALATRRLDLHVPRVADHFGVLAEVVRRALRFIDPIMVSLAITSHSPLPQAAAQIVEALKERGFFSPLTVGEIMDAVCRTFGVRTIDLTSARRTRDIVRPRQVVMALARHLTERSLPEIGRRMGGRDHTTVLHASNKIAPYIAMVAPRFTETTPVFEWVAALYEVMQ